MALCMTNTNIGFFNYRDLYQKFHFFKKVFDFNGAKIEKRAAGEPEEITQGNLQLYQK